MTPELKPLVSIVNNPHHRAALIRVRLPLVLRKAVLKDVVIAVKVGLRDKTIASQLAVTNDAMCAVMPVRNEDLARNVPNAKKLRQPRPRAAEMTIHTGRNLMSGYGMIRPPAGNSRPRPRRPRLTTTSETKRTRILSNQLQALTLKRIWKKTLIRMISQRRSVEDAAAAVEGAGAVDVMSRVNPQNPPTLRIPVQPATLMMISAKSCSMKIRKTSSAFPLAA